MPTRFSPLYSTPSNPATPDPLRPSFVLPKARNYALQYANLYWLRLASLRPRVKTRAINEWGQVEGQPKVVERILSIPTHGKLCIIIGTVYMDMVLKPDVLSDLAREHYLALPPPLAKIHSETDTIMLEDESGRIRLVGDFISSHLSEFVTGTILAALGAETTEGDFEVAGIVYAGMPEQGRMKHAEEEEGGWVAIVSGLEIGRNVGEGEGEGKDELRREMLREWLSGELEEEGSKEGDESRPRASQITRLILAGNSLCQPSIPNPTHPTSTSTHPKSNGATPSESAKPKRYGYDSSLFSSLPCTQFDAFLSSLLPSLPVDVLSGELDPTGSIMPQQDIHKAMLPGAASFEERGGEGGERFGTRTNPFWFDLDGCEFLGHSGQPLDDIARYLSTPSLLSTAAATLEWSHIAPTCPDTLWCYPFATTDPFILHKTPHVYFIGNQDRFETTLVKSEDGEGGEKSCRVVLVPRFCETGEIVLVRCGGEREVRVLRFGVEE